MDSNRRTILTTGAAATTIAAVPRALAQQVGQGGGATSFYEKGAVRIHFEEAGSGFPLLLIPGGGLNSTISNFTRNSPFNPIEEFKGEYRCITADLRNANSGQSVGPLEFLWRCARYVPSSGRTDLLLLESQSRETCQYRSAAASRSEDGGVSVRLPPNTLRESRHPGSAAAACHNRTNVPQQIHLLDHVVGNREQRRRHDKI
jgi:hypothetical protein